MTSARKSPRRSPIRLKGFVPTQLSLLLLLGSAACGPSPERLDPPRLTAGRFSFDLSHKVCESPSDDLSAWRCHLVPKDRDELARNVGRALRESQAPPETYRSRLLSAIVSGREHELLGQTAQTENPEVLNDRAVLLRSLAEREGRPDFLPLAFEAAYQAVEAAPSDPIARFNLVRLMVDLGLGEQAHENGSRLLEIETDPGWRAEIEAMIGGEAVAARPIETTWLPPHYTLTAEDAQLAHSLLEAASRWVDHPSASSDCISLEQRARASGLLQEAAGALCEGSIDRRRPLARAILGLANAFSRLDQGMLAESLQALEDSAAELERLTSPLAIVASVESAAVLYNQGDRSEAKSRLESALSSKDCSDHESLCARVGWLLGMTRYVTGSREEGGALLESTARFYDRYDRPALKGIVNALAADAYKPLGNDFLIWRALERALRALPEIRQPVRAMQVLNIAADVARFADHRGLALHFQRESLSVALRTADPSLEATANNWLAPLEYRAGNPAAAQGSLTTAQRLALEVRDPGRRRMVEAETSLIEGLLLTDQAPERALGPLQVAAEFYSRRGHVFSTLARRALARALRTLGRDDQALEQIHSTIEYLENVKRGMSRDSLSLTLAASWQGPFDEAVSMLLRRDEHAAALAMSERSRRLSMRSESAISPLPASDRSRVALAQQVQEALPSATVVVCFEALEDGIAGWIITKDDFTFFWTEMDPKKLDDALMDLQRLDDTDIELLSKGLIEPWIDRVSATDHLVLVPDRQLEGVPFARLRPELGEYLVDRSSFEVALTLTGWRDGLLDRSRPAAELRPGIVVAHGDRDSSALRYVSAEVEAVKETTSGTIYVRDGQSEVDGELAAFMARQQAVHIAGHALSDPFGPRILLGDAEGPELELRPSALRELPLDDVFLVTLSACSTHRPGVDREEVASLARPLLLSGVTVVGATLWDIRDDLAHDFYLSFFEELGRGATVEKAFSRAQRKLRRRPDLGPNDWAAFQLMTGGIH